MDFDDFDVLKSVRKARKRRIRSARMKGWWFLFLLWWPVVGMTWVASPRGALAESVANALCSGSLSSAGPNDGDGAVEGRRIRFGFQCQLPNGHIEDVSRATVALAFAVFSLGWVLTFLLAARVLRRISPLSGFFGFIFWAITIYWICFISPGAALGPVQLLCSGEVTIVDIGYDSGGARASGERTVLCGDNSFSLLTVVLLHGAPALLYGFFYFWGHDLLKAARSFGK